MNYTLILAGNYGDKPPITLGVFESDPWARPQLNQQIEFRGKIYVVVACNPTSNPSDVTVAYTIEPFNSNAPYKA